MTDYNAMSLDELETHAYSMPHTDICDFAAVRWELVKRRIVQDVYLDLAEQLDAEGLVVVRQSVLDNAETALTDWLHVYAPEHCHEARVAAAQSRVYANGTIAYIGEAINKIRAAPLPASPSSVEG